MKIHLISCSSSFAEFEPPTEYGKEVIVSRKKSVILPSVDFHCHCVCVRNIRKKRKLLSCLPFRNFYWFRLKKSARIKRKENEKKWKIYWFSDKIVCLKLCCKPASCDCVDQKWKRIVQGSITFWNRTSTCVLAVLHIVVWCVSLYACTWTVLSVGFVNNLSVRTLKFHEFSLFRVCYHRKTVVISVLLPSLFILRIRCDGRLVDACFLCH